MKTFDTPVLREVLKRTGNSIYLRTPLSQRNPGGNDVKLAIVGFIVLLVTVKLHVITVMLAASSVLVPLVTYLFMNRIAAYVERMSYADSREKTSHDAGLISLLMTHSAFLIRYGFINLLLMSLYAMEPVYLIASWLINSALLGKEFFKLISQRHMTPPEAERLAKSHQSTVQLVGGMIMAIAAIPLVGFLAPFIGIILMVHLLHVLRGRPVEHFEQTSREAPAQFGKHRTQFTRAAESYQRAGNPDGPEPVYGDYKPYDIPQPYTAPPRTKSDIPYELLDEIAAPPAKASLPEPAYGKYEPATPKQVERGTRANTSREISTASGRSLPTTKRYPEKYSHIVKKK